MQVKSFMSCHCTAMRWEHQTEKADHAKGDKEEEEPTLVWGRELAQAPWKTGKTCNTHQSADPQVSSYTPRCLSHGNTYTHLL